MSIDDLTFVGSGLVRPECVLCTVHGVILSADWRGGVARLNPDGTHILIEAKTAPGDPAIKPNGFALERDGSLLIADLSEARAGVWRLQRSGLLSPFLLEVDGEPLPPVNFVYRDIRGRVWITVSTRTKPRTRDYRPDASTGFIVLVDQRGARVVADGLGYTNECKLDPSGQWLYVNETFGRRLTRFRIHGDGSLGNPETVATFGPGTFPDGLAFDVEGYVWITSIVSNRVIRVDPCGKKEIVLEDSDPGDVARIEAAFQAGTMDHNHLDQVCGRRLKSISSLAFGGADRKTVYLGCLLGDSLATFRSPVAGVPPVHWTYPSPYPSP